MRDTTTVVTETHRLAPAPRTPPANRVKLLPSQRLTRAHLAAQARPDLTSSLAAAAQRVAQAIGSKLGAPLECRARLTDATLHPFTHLGARALFVTVELSGDTLAVVELDLLVAGALLRQVTGTTEGLSAPMSLTRIEEAALGWLALATLATMRSETIFSPFSPRLVGLTLDRGEVLKQLDGRRRHVAVQLDLQLGTTHGGARLLLPALWLQAKLEAQPAEPNPGALQAVLDAGLAADCVLGWALLPRAQARALTSGDVVLFSGVTPGAQGLEGPGRLVARTFELNGSFTAAGFTITRVRERPSPESTMSHADPTVPVEVEIELTRLRLPLHQLGAVKPGGVLPLHINAAQQVVVRIGDKAVARAELVEIEGEIGARIVSML